MPADRKCGGPASQTHRSLFDECSDTTARHSPDLPPERRGKRSPPVVWSALRSGLRPSLRSDQTTDPTGHHSRRSTGHRSCRRAAEKQPLPDPRQSLYLSSWLPSFPLSGTQHHILGTLRSEEHTSELQSLMRLSYAVFC